MLGIGIAIAIDSFTSRFLRPDDHAHTHSNPHAHASERTAGAREPFSFTCSCTVEGESWSRSTRLAAGHTTPRDTFHVSRAT